MHRNKDSLSNNLRSLLKYLPQHRHQQLLLMMGLAIASALSEVISLGALLPFLGVISNPQEFMENPKIYWIIQALSINSPLQLSIWLTLGFITTVLTANALRLITLWFQSRLIASIANDLSVACYRSNLLQSYSFYMNRNSSELIVGLTDYLDRTVWVVYATMSFMLHFLMLTTVLFGLLLIDWRITLGVIAIFGALIIPVLRFTRQRLARNSNKIVEKSSKRVKIIQEGIGGIRDILLDGSQAVFIRDYGSTDLNLRQLNATNQFMGSFNRPYMEAVAITAISIIVLLMLQTKTNFTHILPVLGTLVLGLNRILPYLQQCYVCWAGIKSNSAIFKITLANLEQPVVEHYLKPLPNPLVIDQELQLQNVWFRYHSELDWVLRDLSLTIPANSTIGFVGGSGCGKSTTADLILGLLQPQKGHIIVDGIPLDNGETQWAWQQNVAHVPQSIYLSDATVAENIAFGVELKQINLNRIREVARLARINGFIEQLPNRYEEMVGERGVRLSGGQRQRLGIARALYKNASVIVFDEATSALDTNTEQEVMEAIYGLKNRVTLIIIAHRLSTLKQCSRIFEFKEGQIIAFGTYDEMCSKPDEFAHS